LPSPSNIGKLGNGKSLISVGRIQDKRRTGCIVAINISMRKANERKQTWYANRLD
jgi:hypothetical protein